VWGRRPSPPGPLSRLRRERGEFVEASGARVAERMMLSAMREARSRVVGEVEAGGDW
jgi:hypothetical protein